MRTHIPASLCRHMYTCTKLLIQTGTCTHARQAHTLTQTHLQPHTFSYRNVLVYACAQKQALKPTDKLTPLDRHVYTQTHPLKQTYIHTPTHTYKQTHTLMQTRPNPLIQTQYAHIRTPTHTNTDPHADTHTETSLWKWL